MTVIYNTMINESQRRIIELALDAQARSALIKGCAMSEEFTDLRQLVKDMPKVEKEDPGAIHALCL